MAKISIVRRRLERRKNLETSALSRARELETSNNEANDFFDVTVSEPEFDPEPDCAISPNTSLPELAEHAHGLLDLELTENQTDEIKKLFPINYSNENNPINSSAGLEIFQNPDNKIVFRFNIRPSHPFQTLTTEDVCEMLKISRSTLYKTVHDNGLPGFKIGSQLRFLLEDVIQYLEKCKYNTNLIH
jgi:excisionase family DNA binding protein